MIRSTDLILQKNIRIHEASHTAVGVMLGIGMEFPKVFSDGSGVAPFNLDEARAKAKSSPEIEDVPSDKLRLSARHIAAVYCAGYAGEAIASGSSTAFPLMESTLDLNHAFRVLHLANIEPNEMESEIHQAWSLAIQTLKRCWPAVEELAGMIDVTPGSHQPPKLH